MSVALKRFSNHIGGKAADSSSGETIDVVNPATGEVIAAVPSSTAEDIDHAVEAAERAFFGDWGDTTPGRAVRDPEQARRRARRARRGAGRARVPERRQAARRAPSRRSPARRDCLRFMAGAARTPEGQAAAEYVRGLDLDDPARADRRRRPDHAVELPADDGGVEDLARARRRQHGRAEAVRDHAADHAADGRDRGRHPARGRAQHRLGLRRPGRRGHLVAPARPAWSRSRARSSRARRSPARPPTT